jgi:hypothetical protein
MGLEMQLLTITPDDWHIDEKQPELRVKQWRAAAARWLNKLGFTGLGVVEFQPYLNHPNAKHGRVISGHLHVMGFPDDLRSFKKRVTEFNTLNASRCTIGAFAVARPIKLTEADVAMVAYYLFEPLHWAKRLTPSRKNEGKVKHRKDRLPFHLALRCAEIVSYVSVTDLLITRGRVAWGWRQQLLGAVELASPDYILDHPELDRLWTAVWREDKARGYERVAT